MSKFKPGDQVIYLPEPDKVWTVLSVTKPYKDYPIEIYDGIDPSGDCSEDEIRLLTKLEKILK